MIMILLRHIRMERITVVELQLDVCLFVASRVCVRLAADLGPAVHAYTHKNTHIHTHTQTHKYKDAHTHTHGTQTSQRSHERVTIA